MKKFENSKKNCPVCGSNLIEPLVDINDMPVHCNLLWSTGREAAAATKGNISLGICKDCTHIYNYQFDSALMDYENEYENSLHYSKVFKSFAQDLVNHIVHDFGVRNKKVIEIGSGRGDFLSLVCETGNNEGIGFDPSYTPSSDDPKNVKIIRDFYSKGNLQESADLVCSRHVLEHLEKPKEFLMSVREALEGSEETLLYIEVPNALYTLRDMGIWDIIYEHCSYFTIISLGYLLSVCGFEILELEETYSGQFLSVFARPTDMPESQVKNRVDISNIIQTATSFSEGYSQKVSRLRLRLDTLAESGKRVVVWGAGSKGVTFANIMKLNKFVPYLVDINPKKKGKYVAGTGQKIVSPEFLQKYQPEMVILLNPLYKEEIQKSLTGLGLVSEIFVG